MSLLKLTESSDSLFYSMDLILENTDNGEYRLKDRLEENLLDIEDKVKQYEAELRGYYKF